MRRLSLVVLLAFVSIRAAHAWEPARNAEGELGEYIGYLKTAGDSAFVSECQFDESIKATVVFPLDSSVGHFFVIRDQIRADHAYATTTGEIEVLGNSLRIKIDIDIDPMNAYRQLATNLMSFPFHLRTPDQLDLIFAEPAFNRC